MRCARPASPRTTRATVRFGSSSSPPVTSLAAALVTALAAEPASRPAGKQQPCCTSKSPRVCPGALRCSPCHTRQSPRALEHATELLKLTERLRDPAMAVGHRLVGQPLLLMRRFEEARTHFAAASDLYDPPRHRPLAYTYGHEPGMAARVLLPSRCFGLARRTRVCATETKRSSWDGKRRTPTVSATHCCS